MKNYCIVNLVTDKDISKILTLPPAFIRDLRIRIGDVAEFQRRRGGGYSLEFFRSARGGWIQLLSEGKSRPAKRNRDLPSGDFRLASRFGLAPLHARQLLRVLMEHISDAHYLTGWNTDLEHLLWEQLLRPSHCRLVQENVAKKVMPIKIRIAEEKRRPFSTAELKRLLMVANDEWRGLILSGLYTAQRLGDIAQLTWNQVDLENREIRFVTSKTQRRFSIPI